MLHGNVHDLILDDPDGSNDKRSPDERLLSCPSFCARCCWKRRPGRAVGNVSTGVKFVRGKIPSGFEDLLITKEPAKVLPLIERLLLTQNNVAFGHRVRRHRGPSWRDQLSTIDDRATVVTLQRWSTLPAIDKNDSLIFLLVENLSELHPAGRQPTRSDGAGADPRQCRARRAAQAHPPRHAGR